jgi:hypothetical protein
VATAAVDACTVNVTHDLFVWGDIFYRGRRLGFPESPTVAPTLAPTPGPTAVVAWTVGAITGASVERSCCLCNYWVRYDTHGTRMLERKGGGLTWRVTSPFSFVSFLSPQVRVLVTPTLSGTSFRLGFQGGNLAYTLATISLAPAVDASPPGIGTPGRTSVPIGGVSPGHVSVPANGRTMTDWVTMPITAGTSYVVEFFHV